VSNFKNFKKKRKCILTKRLKYGKKGLVFGNYGFMAEESFKLSLKMLDTLKLVCARNVKPGKFWFRASASYPVTRKAAETRMGKGKGVVKTKEGVVNSGQIFLEFYSLKKSVIDRIGGKIKSKLPVSFKLIVKNSI
jgi:large subunit ribosomal protein L16